MRRPTRFYSNRQEEAVARAVGGKKTANSGATAFYKGDVLTADWLFECKTVVEPRKSFSLKKEWFHKAREEMLGMGKHYSAIVFNFGDNENYYAVDERTFKMLLECLRGF